MSKESRINLTTEQRAELESFIHTGNSPARSQTRARILLMADRSQGQERTDEEVAQAVLCSKHTVLNIRHRFHAAGLPAALYDKPRPGQPPKLTGELEVKLTVLACSNPPAGKARWTLRLLAERMIELGYVDYVSHVTVGEWLKKMNLSLGG
jgi:transposase